MKKIASLSVVLAVFSFTAAKADVIADWTFQSSASTNNIIGTGKTPGTTQSGILADLGIGTASASHASATTAWTIPAGNGSTNSWSSAYWAIGDYYQFSVSTLGFSGITLSFDQTSSNTGPGGYNLAYSTDGSTFYNFTSYTVLANAAPNTPWSVAIYNSAYTFNFNLSSISALNNQSTIFIRLVDNSTVSANGGGVGTGGTDRVDNFLVSASPVPEPSSLALGLFGGCALLAALRRKS